MTTIVTRAGKGSPLTNNEVDTNFTNLNSAKIETLTSTDASVTITGTGSSRDLSVPVNPNVVSGPASATDNAVARFDTTTGKLVQNSVVTVDDTGIVAGASISGSANTLTNISNAALTNSSITINGAATSLGGSVSVGTVTSIGITAGSAITVSGSPVTSSGNITVGVSSKLAAIDSLSGSGLIAQNGSGTIFGRTITAGSGISVSNGNGASGDPTITNSGVTSAAAGTGITVSGATGAVTITNTAPDQTVSIASGSGISVTGTYPNFTVASTVTGATITDDTSTDATRYVLFDDATSGTLSSVNTSSTKFTFNPSTGTLTVGGDVVSSSDESLKTNWKSLDSSFIAALANVKSGVYDRIDTGATQVGVSAQSLQNVIPEAVHLDVENKLTVAYGNAALAACVELAKEVVKLRQEIEALKGK